MRDTAGENSLMMLDCAGKSALFMSEQLRLDQGLRELRQVDGDKITGKALGEATTLFIKRNVTGTTDCCCGRAFTGPGLTEQQGGKIFHPVPQTLFVTTDIVGKDIVPQGTAQPAHGTALTDQLTDKKERPSQLIEKGEIMPRLLGLETVVTQPRQQLAGEGNRTRLVTFVNLLLDQIIERRQIMMELFEQQPQTQTAQIFPGIER